MSRRTPSAPRAPRSRADVVALVFGLVLTSLAVGALWLATIGPLDWSLLKTVTPLGLVVVGVLGLFLSRRGPTP